MTEREEQLWCQWFGQVANGLLTNPSMISPAQLKASRHHENLVLLAGDFVDAMLAQHRKRTDRPAPSEATEGSKPEGAREDGRCGLCGRDLVRDYKNNVCCTHCLPPSKPGGATVLHGVGPHDVRVEHDGKQAALSLRVEGAALIVDAYETSAPRQLGATGMLEKG